METLTSDTEKMEITSKDSDTAQKSETSAPSKNALKKAAKEAEKAEKKAEAAAKRAAEGLAASAEAPDSSIGKYGTLPLIQSTSRTGIFPNTQLLTPLEGEKRGRIAAINSSVDGTQITVRARVHNLRLQG